MATTSEPMGRAHDGQSSIVTPQHRFPTADSTMRVGSFLDHDPSVAVRSLTKALVDLWPKGSQPRRQTIAKLRGRIAYGGIEPVRPLYTYLLGAIEEGKHVDLVTQPLKDCIALLERAAGRREKRTAGVIPIREAHNRVLTTATLEDGQADACAATVDLDSVDSLNRAIAERVITYLTHPTGEVNHALAG